MLPVSPVRPQGSSKPSQLTMTSQADGVQFGGRARRVAWWTLAGVLGLSATQCDSHDKFTVSPDSALGRLAAKLTPAPDPLAHLSPKERRVAQLRQGILPFDQLFRYQDVFIEPRRSIKVSYEAMNTDPKYKDFIPPYFTLPRTYGVNADKKVFQPVQVVTLPDPAAPPNSPAVIVVRDTVWDRPASDSTETQTLSLAELAIKVQLDKVKTYHVGPLTHRATVTLTNDVPFDVPLANADERQQFHTLLKAFRQKSFNEQVANTPQAFWSVAEKTRYPSIDLTLVTNPVFDQPDPSRRITAKGYLSASTDAGMVALPLPAFTDYRRNNNGTTYITTFDKRADYDRWEADLLGVLLTAQDRFKTNRLSFPEMTRIAYRNGVDHLKVGYNNEVLLQSPGDVDNLSYGSLAKLSHRDKEPKWLTEAQLDAAIDQGKIMPMQGWYWPSYRMVEVQLRDEPDTQVMLKLPASPAAADALIHKVSKATRQIRLHDRQVSARSPEHFLSFIDSIGPSAFWTIDVLPPWHPGDRHSRVVFSVSDKTTNYVMRPPQSFEQGFDLLNTLMNKARKGEIQTDIKLVEHRMHTGSGFDRSLWIERDGNAGSARFSVDYRGGSARWSEASGYLMATPLNPQRLSQK